MESAKKTLPDWSTRLISELCINTLFSLGDQEAVLAEPRALILDPLAGHLRPYCRCQTERSYRMESG